MRIGYASRKARFPGVPAALPHTGATAEVAVGRASQGFDRQLFTDKLKELSDQMQPKSMASDRKARVASRETVGWLLSNIVDGQLALLSDWIERLDRAAREVLEIQGEAPTPEFVRDVLLPEAMNLIETRKGTVMSSVSLTALRTRDTVCLQRAQHHLVMELNKLKARVRNRYGIEARELEYSSQSIAIANPSGADRAASPFNHSEDYRTVTVRAETYKLTSQQAQMVQFLHEAHKRGNPDVSITHILEQLEKKSSRWQDTFKSNPRAKKALVESGTRKGTLRLKL